MRYRVLGMTVSAVLVCSLVVGCTDPAVTETIEAIDAIGTVTLESVEAVESANEAYMALDSGQKEQVSNIDSLEEAQERLNQIAYEQLVAELNATDELHASYFAQFYDMSNISYQEQYARSVIEHTTEEEYIDALESLKTANEEFESFISERTSESYSRQTNGGECPFAFDVSALPEEWSFQPASMQTSSHPTWVTSHREATDLPEYINFFINGGSRDYTYQITDIPTTEIRIRDENGDIRTALVNTQVSFAAAFDQSANQDPNKELNERPAYLLVTKENHMVLALQNYDGEDWYVPYLSYS